MIQASDIHDLRGRSCDIEETEGLKYPKLTPRYPYLLLSSGAGHDAQILAAKTDAAVIFIPSPDGVSHSPQEAVRWEDLEKGANLLLQALVKLAE